MPYVLSPRAQADLGEIWDHTLSRWGSDQAERYLRQIQAALELLTRNPRLGRSASAIRRGYRKHARVQAAKFDHQIHNQSLTYFFIDRAKNPTNCSMSHKTPLRRSFQCSSYIERSLSVFGCTSEFRFIKKCCTFTHSGPSKVGAGTSSKSVYAARRVRRIRSAAAKESAHRNTLISLGFNRGAPVDSS